MKLRCYIVDDEPLAIRILEKYILRCNNLELIGSTTEPLKALDFLQNNKVDLLFLDINMPELSGIGLAKVLSRLPLLVFTTAYPEYAVQGFELEALDYLVKPIAFERFLQATNKAQTRLSHTQESEPTHLVVKADKRLYHIKLDDIQYVEAYGDYVKIHIQNEIIVPKETLQNIEEQLPASRFMRVHRSYVVALNAITFLEGNLLYLSTQKIPVGQSYREALLQRLG